MTRYSLKIIDNGRYPLETILAIQDLIKIVLEPIYTVGEFPTCNPNTKTKRIPTVLSSKTFEKILSLIIEDGIRYIDTTIDGYNIKFHTRNPKFYKYEYYLNLSKNSPVIIIK